MPNSPQITVLMSVYNAAEFVGQAVQSVLDQTFSDWELLIVDDGSIDDSIQIVSKFSDPRIRIITNESNLGLTKSLNRGLGEAKAEFVTRLDADDLMHPTRLQKQLDILTNQPQVQLVTSYRELIDTASGVINQDNVRYAPEDYFYILHFRNCIVHSSVMFRRSFIQSLGGYDEHYLKAQDFALWHKLSKQGVIMQIPEILVSIRQSVGSISSQFSSAQAETVTRVVASDLKLLLGTELPAEVLDSLIAYDPAKAKLTNVIIILDAINDMIRHKEASVIQQLHLSEAKLYAAMSAQMRTYLTKFKQTASFAEKTAVWKSLRHKFEYLDLFI